MKAIARTLFPLAILAAATAANAQSLSINFIGSGRNDNYTIELYEVGATSSSRFARVNVTNQITFQWDNLVVSRWTWSGRQFVNYFVRVRNSAGVVYQTHDFDLVSRSGVVGKKLTWGVNFLGY